MVHSRAAELGPAVRRPASLDEQSRNEARAVAAEIAGNRELAAFYRQRNAALQPSHCAYVAGLERANEQLSAEVEVLRVELEDARRWIERAQ